MGDWTNIKGKDGEFKAYVARPEGQAKGTVVVIQEIFGVNAVMRGKCDWLAREGFWALAPDLFWRIKPGIELTDQTDGEWKQAIDYMIENSVLAENNSFGQELSTGFATDFAAVGGKVVTTTNFDPTSSSSASLATAALAAKPEAVLILADSLPTAALLKAFAAQGQHPSDLPMYVANISTALAQQYAGLGS